MARIAKVLTDEDVEVQTQCDELTRMAVDMLERSLDEQKSRNAALFEFVRATKELVDLRADEGGPGQPFLHYLSRQFKIVLESK